MEWIKKQYPIGFCLTLARSVSPETLLQRLGVDMSSAEPRAWDELRGMGGDGPVVRAGRAGGWSFAVEGESTQAIDPDLLGAVARDTVAVALARVVKPMTVILVAEDRQLVTMFDVTMPGMRYGTEPDRLVEVMRQVGLDPEGLQRPEDPVRAMFDLATRAFDVRVPEVDPGERLLTGRLARGGAGSDTGRRDRASRARRARSATRRTAVSGDDPQ